MAPAGARGKAVAMVGMGLSVATVLGVPAAQALGSAMGWQAAYALVVIVGVLTLAGLWILMPHMTRMPPTSVKTELGAFARPQVWLSLDMEIGRASCRERGNSMMGSEWCNKQEA